MSSVCLTLFLHILSRCCVFQWIKLLGELQSEQLPKAGAVTTQKRFAAFPQEGWAISCLQRTHMSTSLLPNIQSFCVQSNPTSHDTTAGQTAVCCKAVTVVAAMRGGLDFCSQVICMNERAQAPPCPNAVWYWDLLGGASWPHHVQQLLPVLILCSAAWRRAQGCTSQSLPGAEQGRSLQAGVTEGVLVLAL